MRLVVSTSTLWTKLASVVPRNMSILPTNRDQKDYYKVTDQPRELSADDLAFLARYTGKPPHTLRPHVIDVWRSTKEQCWAFKCVQDFLFLLPEVQKHPHYSAVCAALEQSLPDQQVLHLDVGCCYGQDTRQLIMDGWKHKQIVALDLVPNYWNMGKVLFMDQDSLKVPFLAGSMTDDAFVSESKPSGTSTEHLMGVADFCWAGRILHCLSKTDCKKFLRNTCSLLKPGGSLYGTAAGFAEAREHVATPDGTAHRIFHSPESLREMMLSVGFIEVEIGLDDIALHRIRVNADDNTDNVGLVMLWFTGIKQ